MVTGIEMIYALSSVDIYSLWLYPLLSDQHANRTDQHWASDLSPLSKGTKQLSGDKLITLDHIHLGRGSTLFSLKETLCMWICLLCLQNFWKIYHAWVYRMLYSLAWYSHSIASVRATHFTENRLCSWNSVVLLSRLSAQRSWSDRTVECPFEDSVSVPWGVTPANTTWDWRNVP